MLSPLRQPASINLRSIAHEASFIGCTDITVSHLAERSDDCQPGSLFAALPGTHAHGRTYVEHAIQRGAAAILTDRPLADVSLPQCITLDARQVYGRLCQALYAFPSQSLGVAGVTGTNGKTTTTWLVRSLLESALKPVGIVGTIEYNNGIESRPARLTTPDALTLAQNLASMREVNTPYAAIELSSHALKQQRAAGIELDAAVITNITRDHLDYHVTLDDYLQSKSLITQMVKPGGLTLLNADDPHTESLLEMINPRGPIWTFGLDSEADLQAENIRYTPTGTHFDLLTSTTRTPCFTSLVGRHNVSNCLAAAAVGLHFGLTTKQIAIGLEDCGFVPGRMQPVNCGQPYQVLVDFAHTDDALKHVIQSARSFTKGKIIVCFGAGGDRDTTKRPLMGKAASLADEIILTSDNPRSESAAEIVQQIMSGVPEKWGQPLVELDREKAIRLAIDRAGMRDTVIIAGKGHETTQTIGTVSTPFDDAAVCRRAIFERHSDSDRRSSAA